MRFDKLAWVLGTVFAVSVAGVSPAFAQYGAPPPPPGPGGYSQGGYYQPYYPPPPPPPGIQRQGFAAGLSFGGGSVGLQPEDRAPGVDNQTYSGLAISFFLGASLTQQASILFDVWGTLFKIDDNLNGAHNIYTLNLRYFPVPKLWVQLGVGISDFTITDNQDNTVGETEDAGVLLGAVGVDLFQGWSYSIDISLRLALSNYEENPDATTGALQVGFNWY